MFVKTINSSDYYYSTRPIMLYCNVLNRPLFLMSTGFDVNTYNYMIESYRVNMSAWTQTHLPVILFVCRLAILYH